MERWIHLNSNYGSKGFILTMDIALGIAIIFIVIALSSALFVESKETIVADLSSLRLATDIVAVLDYNKVFEKGASAIASNITQILPSNLKMNVLIDSYDENLTLLSTSVIFDNLTENYFSGRWISISVNNETAPIFKIIKYKVAFR